MNAIIKECIIYLIFVLVVYFISYQERDRRSFLFAQNIKSQFFGGKPSFSNVSYQSSSFFTVVYGNLVNINQNDKQTHT